MVDWMKARHWEFLRPWFAVLQGRLTPHSEFGHPVRVGIDVEDWWIRVKVSDVLTDLSKLRTIRHALLIVSAFAQLNRDCCMQYLQTFSLFRAAPYMLVDEPMFLPRFDVAQLLGGDQDWELRDRHADGVPVRRVDEAHVEAALHAFFVVERVSVQFVETWARVLDMQDRVGRASVCLETVKLLMCLDVRLTQSQAFVHCVRALHDAIKTTQEIARERECVPRAEAVSLEPIFEITVMNLNLAGSPMDLEEVRALRALVELGVPMNLVRLPSSPTIPVSYENPSFLWAWAALLRSLMGHSGLKRSAAHSKRIRRLEVPTVYDKEPFRSALFSTLVVTSCVSELRLYSQAEDDDTPYFAVLDTATWQWIAWMVSHETGQTQQSIDSLSLVHIWIDQTFVDLLDPTQRRHAPMEAKLKSHLQGVDDFDANVPPKLGPSVTIPEGTELSIHYNGGFIQSLVSEETVPGVVIQGKCDDLSTVLLVRGIGICSLPRSALPPKHSRADVLTRRTQANERCSLVNLRILCCNRVLRAENPLTRLVELLGESLRGLHVDIQGLNNAMLSAFVKACPSLENLSFGETETLDWLFTAYSQGCKVSSLAMSMQHEDGLLQLAERLKLRTEPASQRLSRLSIPRNRNSLLSSYSAMLGENKSITHFQHGYGCGLGLGYGVDFDINESRLVDRHHNERVQRPLTPRQRLAFLSVVRARNRSSPMSKWGDLPTTLILEFAAELPRRSVYPLIPTRRVPSVNTMSQLLFLRRLPAP